MPKLSISEVTTRDWTFDEDVSNYAAAGIEGIGVWRDKLDTYGTEEGIDLLRQSPLKVANLVNSGWFLAMTRSQTKRAVEDVIEAIGVARRLKAGCILIVTGEVGSFHRSLDQARRIVIESLKEVAPVAQAAGVKLAIEPIHERYPGYTFLHTIQDALGIADAVGSPNVGLFFDSDHLFQAPDLMRDIERAGSRIFGVHINDLPALPGPGIDRRLLGDGVIPLKEILSAISAAGYEGFYDVEIMSDSVWAMDYHQVLERLRTSFASLWT